MPMSNTDALVPELKPPGINLLQLVQIYIRGESIGRAVGIEPTLANLYPHFKRRREYYAAYYWVGCQNRTDICGSLTRHVTNYTISPTY